MISIAICDEEGIFGQDLKEFVSRYMKYKGILYQIDIFGKEDELISLGIEMIKYTIVFLVINLNEMNVVMTAKSIRNVSKDIFIVFVAECADYALEGYKVDAIRYLLKNDTDFQSTIDECLDAIIDEMNYKVLERELAIPKARYNRVKEAFDAYYYKI